MGEWAVIRILFSIFCLLQWVESGRISKQCRLLRECGKSAQRRSVFVATSGVRSSDSVGPSSTRSDRIRRQCQHIQCGVRQHTRPESAASAAALSVRRATSLCGRSLQANGHVRRDVADRGRQSGVVALAVRLAQSVRQFGHIRFLSSAADRRFRHDHFDHSTFALSLK